MPKTTDIVHGVPKVMVSNTTTRVNKTGSWKYVRPIYRDRVAPCNEGCPVGIDIEGYMNLLREGKTQEAGELLLRENPMPATTGRVCYHPCESACNRRFFDEAVSIHAVERMLGDLALETSLPDVEPRTQRETVAIVGSGPAGLAAAFHLVRQGYAVTIYEAAGKPGGVLRLGIPEYRLPRSILDKEIARIEALGVEFRCGTKIGTDVPWDTLDQYDAVFLATGVHKSQSMHIPGEDAPGFRPGLEFLRDVNEGRETDIGQRVVVIGGGNTAMDCARTALRLGKKPMVLYRRTRAEMPATDEEVQEAMDEGIEFQFLAAPVNIRQENGVLAGLDCTRMRLGEADASGRRRPLPVEGSEFYVPADAVLTAIGEAPEFDTLPEDFTHDDWVLETNSWGSTSKEGYFAGGDIVEQPHTVADALGSGKRAAIAIVNYLRRNDPLSDSDFEGLRYGRVGNVSMTRWNNDDPIHRVDATNDIVPFEDLNMEHFAPVEKRGDRHLAPEKRKLTFSEANQGLVMEAAMEEARRCFNCGVCNSCELCLIFCPDVAITLGTNGTKFIIDYDYCKGCGLCNAECPRGAMAMTREGI